MNNKLFKKIIEIIIIVIGNAILAFGICGFITPHGIIVGGASGIGLIVKQEFLYPLLFMLSISLCLLLVIIIWEKPLLPRPY